jgi:hypothetical protein
MANGRRTISGARVHDYAKEKAVAWQLLGDRIEAILSADIVLPMPRAKSWRRLKRSRSYS